MHRQLRSCARLLDRARRGCVDDVDDVAAAEDDVVSRREVCCIEPRRVKAEEEELCAMDERSAEIIAVRVESACYGVDVGGVEWLHQRHKQQQKQETQQNPETVHHSLLRVQPDVGPGVELQKSSSGETAEENGLGHATDNKTIKDSQNSKNN